MKTLLFALLLTFSLPSCTQDSYSGLESMLSNLGGNIYVNNSWVKVDEGAVRESVELDNMSYKEPSGTSYSFSKRNVVLSQSYGTILPEIDDEYLYVLSSASENSQKIKIIGEELSEAVEDSAMLEAAKDNLNLFSSVVAELKESESDDSKEIYEVLSLFDFSIPDPIRKIDVVSLMMVNKLVSASLKFLPEGDVTISDLKNASIKAENSDVDDFAYVLGSMKSAVKTLGLETVGHIISYDALDEILSGVLDT